MNKKLEKTNITNLKDTKQNIKIEIAAMIFTAALGFRPSTYSYHFLNLKLFSFILHIMLDLNENLAY